jgi:hypothetical protein
MPTRLLVNFIMDTEQILSSGLDAMNTGPTQSLADNHGTDDRGFGSGAGARTVDGDDLEIGGLATASNSDTAAAGSKADAFDLGSLVRIAHRLRAMLYAPLCAVQPAHAWFNQTPPTGVASGLLGKPLSSEAAFHAAGKTIVFPRFGSVLTSLI